MAFNNVSFIGDRLERMNELPDNSIHLIFTSPPYNVNKNYTNNDDDKPYNNYLFFLNETWKKCYEKLCEGGRIAINIATSTQGKLGYKFLYSDIIQQLLKIGFIPRGEIIWNKKNVFKRTAWGSWKSPSNPFLVQPYEFILIFSKITRKLTGNKENIDITKEEFIQYTNSLWEIKPEKAKKIGHPAPFPMELAERIIKFYTYKGNIVLDPFAGSGTTCLAAEKLARKSIYIDNSKEYFEIYLKRRKMRNLL